MKLGTSVRTAMMTIAAALGILGWPTSLTARKVKAPVMVLMVLHPTQAIMFKTIGMHAGKYREKVKRDSVSCRRPSLGPKVAKYATGRVESRLKNTMVRTAGRNESPKIEDPRVPRENVEVVQFAANQSHIASTVDVCVLSSGRTRSMPRASTPNPSIFPTSFHN